MLKNVTYFIISNKKTDSRETETYLTFGFPPCCNINFVEFNAKSKESQPIARWNGAIPFLANTIFASAPFVVIKE